MGAGRCSAALPAAGARQQLRAASSRREKHGMRERTRALRAGDGKARREAPTFYYSFCVFSVWIYIT